MGRRPVESHSQHFNLRDALEQPGCAICTLVVKVVANDLDYLLYERVNDPGTRQELRASGGFCHRHAWELCQFGDGLGVGMLYQSLLERAIASLQPDVSRRRGLAGKEPPTRPCHSCRQADDVARRYLALFVENFDHPAFQSALERAHGVCLPHARQALALCRTDAQRSALTTWERGKLETLLAHLKEFLRKHDYRYAAEGYREREGSSWLQAVEMFVGKSGKAPQL
jgi:hypothetical protein